jgi:hypothetical protein
MPTIAIVEGVRITIYLNDHLPPHLHAFFAGQEAKLSIVTGKVLSGTLPRAKLKAIVHGWLPIVNRFPMFGERFGRVATAGE